MMVLAKSNAWARVRLISNVAGVALLAGISPWWFPLRLAAQVP